MNKLPEDPIKYLRLADFSGGRNTTITPALLNANESPTAKRMSFDQKGTIRPGWGRVSRYDEPFSDQPVSGLGEYRKNDGRTWLMIGAGDKIYYDRPSITWRWEGDALPDDMLKPPGDPTFTRSSVAYKSDGTQVAANVPRFENGKFDKAVMVEEGTTNLLTNPSFEGTYTSGLASNWTAYSTGSATGSYAESTSALAGSKAQQITRTGGAPSDRRGITRTSSAIGATSATISVYIKVLSFTSGAVVRLYGDFTGGPYGVGQAHTITANDVGKWIRLQGSATVGSEDTCNFYVWIEGANADILVDCAQLEAKPYATSFIDGTRSPETLTIPTAGVLNPQEGTVECWVYVNSIVRRDIAGNWPTVVLIRKGASVANWIWLHHNPAGTWELQIRKEDGTITGSGSFSDSLTPDGWHYFAIRWNTQEGLAELFHNGVKRISLANVIFPAEYDRIEIGHRSGSSRDWFNGLIDDLRISNIARGDED